MTRSYMCHDSLQTAEWKHRDWPCFICVIWLHHTCDMTHSYVCHDSFTYVTWHISDCGVKTSRLAMFNFRLKYKGLKYPSPDPTFPAKDFLLQIQVWGDDFLEIGAPQVVPAHRRNVTWLMHTWYDSFICDMSHECAAWVLHMWYDFFMCDLTFCAL